MRIVDGDTGIAIDTSELLVIRTLGIESSTTTCEDLGVDGSTTNVHVSGVTSGEDIFCGNFGRISLRRSDIGNVTTSIHTAEDNCADKQFFIDRHILSI